MRALEHQRDCRRSRAWGCAPSPRDMFLEHPQERVQMRHPLLRGNLHEPICEVSRQREPSRSKGLAKAAAPGSPRVASISKPLEVQI